MATKLKHVICIVATAFALVACSSDNDNMTNAARTVTLTIPVEIYSGHEEMTDTRAASQGDPGTTVDFKAPLYLYIYAYITEGDGSSHELLAQTFTYNTDTEASGAWTLKDAGTANERWQKNVRVTFTLSSSFYDELGKSRVFAVASRRDISSLLPNDASAAATVFGTMDSFKSYTLDFSSIKGDELKDIYSTPYNDHTTPYASTDNGLIVGADNTLTCSNVKLYHVAAKVDFTWQVASELQNSTAVASITCAGVPTTCKVFEPTANPTTAITNCLVLGAAADNPAFEVNAGNKWLGRAYAYMLQPADGSISYTVTYSGSAGKETTSKTFVPASPNTVFTGWYRIVANVK